MLTLTTAQQDALANQHVMLRFFARVFGRSLDDNSEAPLSFWNDVHNLELSGVTYVGGELAEVSDLAVKGDLTIPGIVLRFSSTGTFAHQLLYARKIDQQPVKVYVGIFALATKEVIPPLIPYFDGLVDQAPRTIPASGGEGVIELVCESTSRTLRRGSTETGSHADQQARDAADNFCLYSNVNRRPVYFGRSEPAP